MNTYPLLIVDSMVDLLFDVIEKKSDKAYFTIVPLPTSLSTVRAVCADIAAFSVLNVPLDIP